MFYLTMNPKFQIHYSTMIFTDENIPDAKKEQEERERAKRERSEEHTSELQSLRHLECRLLLEKKKKNFLR